MSQSADKSHHGRMTKQGNLELRWILSQWAVRLMKDDPFVRSWAQKLRRRVHKNKARGARRPTDRAISCVAQAADGR